MNRGIEPGFDTGLLATSVFGHLGNEAGGIGRRELAYEPRRDPKFALECELRCELVCELVYELGCELG